MHLIVILTLFLFISHIPNVNGMNYLPEGKTVQNRKEIRDTLPKIYYIHPKWIFDGENITAGKILMIENGQIKQLLDNDSLIPKGSPVVDATGCTVMPGFFDGHIHFMGPPMWQSLGVDRYGWGKMAEEGYSLFPQNRLTLLQNGITSIIDMGSPIAGYRHLKSAYEKGKIAGPEIFYPGPLFTAPKGHPAGTIYTGQHELITNGTLQIKDEVQAVENVRRLYEDEVNFIKIVYDRMWYTTDGAPRLNLSIAKVIINESHRLGLRVYAHIGSEEEALEMVEAGVDGIEHSFGSGNLSDSLFNKMVKNNIIFTPTLAAFTKYAPQAVRPMQVTVKKASEKGVIIVTGTDYPTSGGHSCGDDLFTEFRLLEEAGISRNEVLRSATHNAAIKAGVESRLGKIAEGYEADLLVVRGTIDEGLLTADRILTVIQNGNIMINNTETNSYFRSRFRSKHIMLIPYFFPDPVNGFNLGLSYTDFDLFNSGVSLNSDVAYSLRDMWSINMQFAVPTPLPLTRVKANLHFDNMSRIFYSLGNHTDKSEGIRYNNLNFYESINTTTTLGKHWKVFSVISGEQTLVEFPEDYEPPEINGIKGSNSLQVGIMAGFDLRDHENNPWKGVLLLAGGDFSPGFISSTGNFGKMMLDFRVYLPSFYRHVLAARVLYKQSFGDVPFYKLPAYGGQETGRGYFPQRFTDRIGLYGQIEYRFPVYKILSSSMWLDAGQVQSSFKKIDTNFHYSFGFGPRLAFGSNENSILALDAGFSNEGFLVYFRTGHAF